MKTYLVHPVLCAQHLHWCLAMIPAILWCGGCGSQLPSPSYLNELQHEATRFLKLQASQQGDPALAALAVSALAVAPAEDALPWIQQGLYDPYPEVRLTAILKLIDMKDATSAHVIERLTRDSDPWVQLAAKIYQVHNRHLQPPPSGFQLPPDAEQTSYTRCHEALMLLLAEYADTQQKDQWRAQCLRQPEAPMTPLLQIAMMHCGDTTITSQLLMKSTSRRKNIQFRSLVMLGCAVEPRVQYVLLDHLKQDEHPACRVAAARSLARFGNQRGADVAYRALDPELITQSSESDTLETEALALACETCGEVGQHSMLTRLADVSTQNKNPRVRIACSEAILKRIRDIHEMQEP